MTVRCWKVVTIRRVCLLLLVSSTLLTYTILYSRTLGGSGPFSARTITDVVDNIAFQTSHSETWNRSETRVNTSFPVSKSTPLPHLYTTRIQLLTVPTCSIFSNISSSQSSGSPTGHESCVRGFLQRHSQYCEKSLKPRVTNLRDYTTTNKLPCLCPCIQDDKHVVIPLTYEVLNTTDLELKYSMVKPGGRWFPSWCTPRHRIAIIIPFAERHDHLKIFLNNMNTFLQNQLVDYTIFIIEQLSPDLFNKAMLMNIGFVEASSRGDFDCFIFHDVCQLPIDNLNYYVCSPTTRHMCAFREKLNYIIAYHSHFGGALAFPGPDFKFVNGFSNRFYGWGAEDDDMHQRVSVMNVKLSERYPVCVSKYRMIPHERDRRNPMGKLKAFADKYYRPGDHGIDGLNSLNYTVIQVATLPLYTQISVNIPPPPY